MPVAHPTVGIDWIEGTIRPKSAISPISDRTTDRTGAYTGTMTPGGTASMNPSVAMTTPSNSSTPPNAPATVSAAFVEYRPPGAARGLALVCGLGVIASAAIGFYLGLWGSQQPAWFVVAFEAVALVAGVFALLAGTGRFASAPGLALLCAAGAVGAGTVLAHVGSGKQVLPAWFLVVRAGLTAGLVVAAAWSVLARNPGPARRSLVRSVMFGAPLAAILAGAWMLRHQAAALPDGVKMAGGFFGFLIVTALAAGAVHCAIRAFEVCDEDPALR